MRLKTVTAFLVSLILTSSALAQISFSDNLAGRLLPVEEAFAPQAIHFDDRVEIRWSIQPGYYLYRKQFEVMFEGEEIASLDLPEGEIAYDPFFDEELEIYRQETGLNFALEKEGRLEVRFQGCADAGYCYPPTWIAFDLRESSESLNYLGQIAAPGEPAQADDIGRVFMPILLTLFTLVGLVLVALTLRGLTTGSH